MKKVSAEKLRSAAESLLGNPNEWVNTNPDLMGAKFEYDDNGVAISMVTEDGTHLVRELDEKNHCYTQWH